MHGRATLASSAAFWSVIQSRACLACSCVRTRAITTAGWIGLVM